MPLVSVTILTKNRREFLQRAVLSVQGQSYGDYEIVIVDDGSIDDTGKIVKDLKIENLKIITHSESKGITQSRQEALLTSRGKYIAILDDDDEWADVDKLKKQVEYLESHPNAVLVGGGIKLVASSKCQVARFRAETDEEIRKTMLLRNNFFTSTVMFRRQEAMEAGGFIKDQDDLGEDYDLWLRLGLKGRMHNFRQVFASYRQPVYNKEKFRRFLNKQVRLIAKYKKFYPYYLTASVILRLRALI